MSNPRIAAQSIPSLLAAFPGWKLPTLVHVRATVAGGAGATTTQTSEGAQGEPATTLGWSLTRVTTGVYDLLFPSVRRWANGSLTWTFKSASAAGNTIVTADERTPVIDRSPTNTVPRGIAATPQTGRIRVGFLNQAGALADLSDNVEVACSLWVDLG